MPNAIWLAKWLHDAYERLAPQYGYETRPETRVFDHESPNGRLMAAVCEELRQTLHAAPSATGATWILCSERMPDVSVGDEELFWVCAQRKHNVQRYVFAQYWVNRPAKPGDYEDQPDHVIYDEDGNAINLVGWCEVGVDRHYDEFFMPVENPEEIIAWMPMVKPSALADRKGDTDAL